MWDMDGLLVDSEPLWTVAEQELAARLGGVLTPAVKAAIVGTRLEVAVPILLRHLGSPAGPPEVAQAASALLQRMTELLAADVPARPGAKVLLAELVAEGVPMALVSSSYRVLVDAVLVSGLGPFAVTVAGDEVTRSKPDPEPYLTAAAALGADPRRCVVLEDSPAGVQSGQDAGCAVVGVPSVAGVRLDGGPRRLVVSSLADLDVATLRRLAA